MHILLSVWFTPKHMLPRMITQILSNNTLKTKLLQRKLTAAPLTYPRVHIKIIPDPQLSPITLKLALIAEIISYLPLKAATALHIAVMDWQLVK